jgi:hypothetical protein
MKSLITALESSLEKIENGSIELAELETMVNQSRELYERLVVVRYKVYANSVLGTKTPLIDEQEVVYNAPIVEAIQAVEKAEETPFDFSLFDEATNEEATNEEASTELVEEKEDEPVAMHFEMQTEEEETIEETPSEDLSNSQEIIETTTNTESVSLFDEPATTLTIEDVQPEIETEKKPVTTSNFDEVKFPTPVFANAPIEVTPEAAPIEDIVPEVVAPIIETPVVETPIMETPVSHATPVVEEVAPSNYSADNEHPLARKIKKIETNVRQNYSIVPLDTLIGSFSLNEKLQLINELFGGSSDEFSSSIKRLDTQVNLESARSILADMAENQRWDLESETTEEFILKICRRYANSPSN